MNVLLEQTNIEEVYKLWSIDRRMYSKPPKFLYIQYFYSITICITHKCEINMMEINGSAYIIMNRR